MCKKQMHPDVLSQASVSGMALVTSQANYGMTLYLRMCYEERYPYRRPSSGASWLQPAARPRVSGLTLLNTNKA